MAGKSQYNLEQFFQALADQTRLRLLNLIGDREICVCYLVEILGCPQPTISRHLAYLRKAGIVAARREGKWMHYRLITPPHPGATEILRKTLAVLKQDKTMQNDRKTLTRACCASKNFAALESAPQPVPIKAFHRQTR
jgi:ArsR family transcriptional regulator